LKLIDIHQANVFGLGAQKFIVGLIREIHNCGGIAIDNVYLNKISPRDAYSGNHRFVYVRYYLGFFSRLVEIFFWRFFRKNNNEILILGDLPLNTAAKQYVLCQQSLIFKDFAKTSIQFYKFWLFRFIFKLFLKKHDIVLVQTEEMAKNIRVHIGSNVNVKVVDVGSNYFDWPDFIRRQRIRSNKAPNGFRVIYPSAFYPHKNHYLLKLITYKENTKIILTLNQDEFFSYDAALTYIGRVPREHIFDLYKEVDALLFLSSNESLGLPILEAIKCNLPIICPRAEYTGHLSANNCFFFEIDDPSSLERAIFRASEKISAGWWPNWSFDEIICRGSRTVIEDILLGRVDAR